MAVLPDADSVGQIDTKPEHKIGVGGWDPGIIGRAANDEGGALEKLGGTMSDVGASIYNQYQAKQKEEQAKSNQLQSAQATGAFGVAEAQYHLDVQNATDPTKIKSMTDDFMNLVPKIKSTISDPDTANLWEAGVTARAAETGARFATRATDLTRNNALATGTTNIQSVIGAAANLDDDAASARQLDHINPIIAGLVAGGAIRETDAVDMRMNAVKQWAMARRDYLEAQMNASKGDPAAIARYAHFTVAPLELLHMKADGTYEPGYGPGGPVAGSPAAAGAPGAPAAPAPTAADGSPLPPPRPAAAPTGDQPGLVKPGNIDLEARPQVKMPDGSIATVRSINVGIDGGKEVLIPTVVDGKVVSNDEAVAHWKKTGENLGTFDSEANATAYAQKLHEAQRTFYAPPDAAPAAPAPTAADGSPLPPPKPPEAGGAAAAPTPGTKPAAPVPAAPDAASLEARIRSVKPASQECVALPQAVGNLPPVGQWSRGDNVMATRPPIGSFVATFMNRDGSPSTRYDGGVGVGDPGNGTTHAGIVAGYTPDGGLILWNQWGGKHPSGGPVQTTYKAGGGKGENDANNYYVINTGVPTGPGAYPAMGGGGIAPSPGQDFPATSLPISTPAGYASYKSRVAQIESQNGKDPNAFGNIYQFMGSTKEKYGWTLDRPGQEAAMDHLTQDNLGALRKGLGRDPTPAELYLAHQQGSGGALQLIQHPLSRAGDIVGDDAIRKNGGDPNASAAAFVNFWQAKYNRTPATGYSPTPGMAVGSVRPLPPEPFLSSPISAFNAATPPAVDSVHPLAPPPSKRPEGATSVAPDPTGRMVYTMADGSTVPVPGSKATAAPWAPAALPGAAPGTVASLLSPQTRAEMQLRAVGEIQRVQREAYAANKRDVSADLGSIRSLVKDMESGSNIPTDGWAKVSNKYGSSDDNDVRLNYAIADQIHTALSGLYHSSPAEVIQMAAAARAKYNEALAQDPTNPNLAVQGAIADSVQKYATNYARDVNTDPLGRAVKEGFIPPLKPINAMSQTLSDDIAQRIQQANNAKTALGLNEPVYFTRQERVDMRRVGQAGGEPMVNMARAVVEGGGPEAGRVFKQIGADAPTFQTIGALALDKNVDQSMTIQQIADTIAALNDKGPSGAAKGVPIFTEQTLWKNVLKNPLGAEDQTGGPLSAFSPDFVGRANATSRILMSNSAMQTKFDPIHDPVTQEFFNEHINKTLGGHYDGSIQYGGLADSDYGKVLIPSNMRADKFNTVISQINASDIAAMGPQPRVGTTPVTPQMLQRAQFVAIPSADGLFHGLYGVKLSEGGAMRKVEDGSGKEWIFNMNKVEGRMRDQVSGSFMDKVSAPPRGAPSPYERVKPMIEEGEGAVNSGGATIPTGSE